MLNRNFNDFKFQHKRNRNQIIYTSKKIQDNSEVLNLSEMLHMDTNRSKIDILNEIELIRAKNNKHWMDLYRLAFKVDPESAAKIVTKIISKDQTVTKLAEKLIK